MLDSILGWGVISSLMLYVPNQTLQKFNIVFFQFFTMIFVAASSFYQRKRKIIGKDFGILFYVFFLVGLVDVLNFKFHIVTISAFLNLSMALILISSCVLHIEDKDRIKRFIVWTVIVNCLYLSVQKFGWNPILNSEVTTGEEGALMGNAAGLGMFLAIALPFVVEESWLGFFLILLIGIMQNEGALVIICMIYALIKNPISIVILIPTGILYLYFKGSLLVDSSLGGRWDLWRCAIEQSFESPFFGWGLGNKPLITSAFHHVANEKPDFIYSSYLQFIFCTGIGGLVAIVLSIRTFVKNFKVQAEDMAILSILILATAKYPIELIRLWIVICVCIGLWIIRVLNRREALCL